MSALQLSSELTSLLGAPQLFRGPDSRAEQKAVATKLFLESTLLELQRLHQLQIDDTTEISKITFREYGRVMGLLTKVGKIEREFSQPAASPLFLPTLTLIEKIRELMIPFRQTMDYHSTWCNRRIKCIKEHAERNSDATLLKIIQIAEDLNLHQQSMQQAKGKEIEYFYPTLITSCELPAFAIGKVFSQATPTRFLNILLNTDDFVRKELAEEKTITRSTAFLRSLLCQEDQNLFVCGFQGPKASNRHSTSIGHWIIIEEKRIENNAFKYRLFFSYLGAFDLKQFLAFQPLETSQGIWITQHQLHQTLDSIDQFIDINERWTPEMTAKYFNLFGGIDLQERETEDFSQAENRREVHVINTNQLRGKITAQESFRKKMVLFAGIGAVSYFAAKFFGIL